MAAIRNPEILATFLHLSTIEKMVDREIANVKNNKQHIDKIVPSEIIGKYSSNHSLAQKYINKINRLTYENAVISMVSTFEKIVFEKYRNTFGTIKKVVSAHTTSPLDYYKIREKLIKSENDINRLHNIIEMLKGHLPEQLYLEVSKIKNYRDYLAHGKRYSSAIDVEPPL
jgi:hypothetical protein